MNQAVLTGFAVLIFVLAGVAIVAGQVLAAFGCYLLAACTALLAARSAR